MSIRVMTRVWDHSRSRNGERLVLLAIADFADDHGRAFPSVASLRAKSAMSERGVQQAIARLQELGELCVEIGAGPHGVNVYWVKLSALVPQAETQPYVAEARPYAAEPVPAEEYTPAESTPPANTAPPQNLRFTPAESAPKPSGNRQVTKRERDARPKTVPMGRAETPTETPPQTAQKTKPEAKLQSFADPLAHLHRPDGWPPVLGLGDLDEPIAELYQAYRSARFPAKAAEAILPGEIRKDLPTLQEMHAAGITPGKITEATQRALAAWSDRARVTLAALAAHWSSLMDDTPPPSQPLRPMAQGGKRRVTSDEAKATVRRGLTTVLTKGDGF